MPATKETCLKEEGQQFLGVIQISHLFMERFEEFYCFPVGQHGSVSSGNSVRDVW